MVNISKLGDSTIKFTFTDNDRYLYNGEITLPLNSLILEFDTSDLVIFKKIDGDVFVTFLLENSNFNSKAELESWYKANMVSSGGGGGGVTPEEVEEMIDEAVSGKQDTLSAGTGISIVDNVISATGGGGGTDAPISAGTGTDSVKENSVNNVASGEYSHAEGRSTTASGKYAHAEGNGTSAKGNYAHAEGHSTVASGDSSHAEGELTNASGDSSHAEGTSTEANNVAAHAEGRSTTASGKYAHAEGMLTVASGQSAHAEGNSTRAKGKYAHAEGNNTIANNESEHASGKYNVSNTGETTSAQTLFSVGNGGWDETAQDVVRHNAFEIRQNGDIYLNNGTSDVKLQDYIQIKVVKLTQQEYDALSPNYDNNTLYVIS